MKFSGSMFGKTETTVKKGGDSAGGRGVWCPFLLSLAEQRDMKLIYQLLLSPCKKEWKSVM